MKPSPIIELSHRVSLCFDGACFVGDFLNESDCLSYEYSVIRIYELVISAFYKGFYLEESVAEVVVIGLEAMLQIGANMVAFRTKHNFVAIGIFNTHVVLFAFATHICIGAFVSINPDPVLFDCFKEAIIYLVFFAYDGWVCMLKHFDGNVITIFLTSEGLNNFCFLEHRVTTDRVFRVSVCGWSNDSIDVQHSIVSF